MNIATALQKRSSLIEYCASSDSKQIIQELSVANNSLIEKLCTSPMSTEVLFYIFNTLYSQNKFRKNSSKVIENFLSLYEKCVEFYLKRLKSSYVITKNSLMSYVNLFYLLNICELSASTHKKFQKDIRELSVYGIEKDLLKIFIENDIEVNDVNIAKYFVVLIHQKTELFKKKLSDKVEHLEKRRELDQMMSILRENPQLQYRFLVKVAEICIALHILIQICMH